MMTPPNAPNLGIAGGRRLFPVEQPQSAKGSFLTWYVVRVMGDAVVKHPRRPGTPQMWSLK